VAPKRFQHSTHRLRDLRAQRERLSARAVPFHVTFLDDLALGILPTDLVVIGAETGAGKTTLGMLFALNSAKRGLRVSYVALEAFTGEIEQRILFQRMAALAWERSVSGRQSFTYAAWMHGRCDALSNELEAKALESLVDDVALLATYYRQRSFTVGDVEPLLSSAASETDLFVFDHLHYVDSDERDENRAMSSVVKLLSDFVNREEKPVIAIAHLRKKDRAHAQLVPDIHEFHGSSAITKIATKVITLAPARDRGASDYTSPTYMAVEKDRLVGKSTITAIVGFDIRRMEYAPRYELGVLNAGRDKWTPLGPHERPWWSSPHAVCKGALP